LPEEVAFNNGNSIKFFYSAEGEKLKVEYVIGGTTTNTCYCANVVYENNNQKYLLNDEGYYDLASGGYHYYLKDHLGNNRVVINQSGTVEQTNHYYPYGGTFASTSTGQPYRYNGKEYNTNSGLNWYDYGARHYDPAIARWMAQDPLAEKYYGWNQYNYCGANPVILVDSEGKAIETAWDAVSLTMGLKSLRDNIRQGKIGAAIADGIGVLLDAAAVATPFVPGGVSAAISAARAVDRVDDIVDAGKALNAVDNAADAAKVVGKTDDIASGTAKTAENTGRYSVYRGRDADGNVKYVGITGRDPEVRFNEHINSGTNRATLDYKVSEGKTGLTKAEARRQEQLLINQYGLEKDGGQPYNKINSISPKKWPENNILIQ